MGDEKESRGTLIIREKKESKPDETAKAPHSKKHWVVYILGTFISFWVFLEFILAQIFFSQLSPSDFIYYLTPSYLLWGRTITTFFFSALFVFIFYVTLSQKVYPIQEKGLTFKSEDSYLLLPFYIIILFSLGYHIIVSPIKLSNLLTYIIFFLTAESFVEYQRVADFKKLKEKLKGF